MPSKRDKSERDENARDERIPLTQSVWEGLEAVRRSGLTNMLDRPMVAYLAGEFGYQETADWVESHRREYAEGIFRGFYVEPEGEGEERR